MGLKKIIGILFAFQLCVLVFYSVFFFHFEAQHRFFHDDVINANINFTDNIDDFHKFVNHMYESELFVRRVRAVAVVGNDHFYTTDVTLGGEVVLISGRFPEEGTAEFISTIQTEDENQVGLIDNIFPGRELSVSHFSDPNNISRDGRYFFHTDNIEAVQKFIAEMEPYILFAEEPSATIWENNFWNNFRYSLLSSVGNEWEFFGIASVLLFSMLLLMLQYGIHTLRAHVILNLHGVSTFRILKYVTWSTFFSLFIGGISAYVLIVIYIYWMRLHLFLADISIYFLVIAVGLALVYLIIINSFVYLKLQFSSRIIIIKGSKTQDGLQVINHGIKVIFMTIFMIFSLTTVESIANLRARLDARSTWETARDVYRVATGWQGNWNPELEVEINERLSLLQNYLTEYHGGFIMAHRNVLDILEWDFSPYHEPENSSSLKLSPSGFRIDISPSYLEMNPIHAINGIDIQEQINWDKNVWNLLVPVALQPYEEEFSVFYLEEFYFQRVHIYNMYADWLENPLLEITMDDLSLNIIYVYDEQDYFTFDSFRIFIANGLIRDPIAVIYTENIHDSNLLGLFMHAFYMQHDGDATSAFQAIQPALERYGLQEQIRFVIPVYDGFRDVIQYFTEQLIRLSVLLFVMILANFAITYYLMATYFETNKFKLVIKRNFGYHTIKRNQIFLFTLLSYSIPAVVITSFLLGWIVLFIGFIALAVDILMALIFEYRLMKKSFAEIMKGER